MGSNYYYRKEVNKCEHCGRPEEVIEYHIGKSSYGWTWLFSGEKFKTAKEWKEFLKANPDNIFDEYNRKISLKNMFKIIEKKGRGHNCLQYPDFYFKDEEGYNFTIGEFS